jgi:hypothetical protein
VILLFLMCMHQLRINVMIKKDSLYEELQAVFD